MNCPKCNSPINDGDKFCQVCGNVLNNAPQQPVVDTPNVMEQPVPMPQQPMPQQPMYNQQPMMGQQPNMMNGVQQSKKNNTAVIILVAVIVVLLIAVAVLFATSGKDDGGNSGGNTGNVTESGNGNSGGGEPTQVKTTTTKKVNEYTFELPDGYDVTLYEQLVVLYDYNHNVEASVENTDAIYRSIDKEKLKANIIATIGATNVTYTTTTKNGKNMVVYSATYNGYPTEFVYVEHTSTKIVCSMIVYMTGKDDTIKNNVYDVLTTVKVEDSGYSTNASTILPNVDLNTTLK